MSARFHASHDHQCIICWSMQVATLVLRKLLFGLELLVDPVDCALHADSAECLPSVHDKFKAEKSTLRSAAHEAGFGFSTEREEAV
uniref:Uncharacterized protein n=1 Tax=Melanopsichium pennsylvanicum 4 TaxID=1398559 RepID=A0A077R8I0_9BASI|nr:uncharacterized protein BN887_06304 [Melanopsichium pennsylvanicum 4]